jgi:ketosteroid isomerase-like protein
MSHADFVRRYVMVTEEGRDEEALRAFFHPEAIHEELPNLLFPKGVTRDVDALLTGFLKGHAGVGEQRFEVHGLYEQGDVVTVEMTWTGRMKVDAGPLKKGTQLRARICTVIELRDGKIARQRNYDCYDPI